MNCDKTQLQVALDRAEALESIPRVTNPMGNYWKQPNRKLIEVDAKYAKMSPASFDKLLEYSTSTPTGIYIGKMWKRQLSNSKWLLCWFEPHPEPDTYSINYREILVEE